MFLLCFSCLALFLTLICNQCSISAFLFHSSLHGWFTPHIFPPCSVNIIVFTFFHMCLKTKNELPHCNYRCDFIKGTPTCYTWWRKHWLIALKIIAVVFISPFSFQEKRFLLSCIINLQYSTIFILLYSPFYSCSVWTMQFIIIVKFNLVNRQYQIDRIYCSIDHTEKCNRFHDDKLLTEK